MGLKYLWDTNAVVYYLQKYFAEAELAFLNKKVIIYRAAISAITQIELLSWRAATERDTSLLNEFINDSIVFELENEVKFKTVELRRMYSIKLPDAIIAATAIINGLTLISNDRGFSKISSLKLLNPFNVA